MKFDMNKMLKEAQRMQEELAKAQEEAASEVVEASAGGGMVTVKANGAGEVVSITIDPRAIDPDDPELLADLVLAAVNEALRSARALMESKMSGLMPGGLGDLGGLLPAADAESERLSTEPNTMRILFCSEQPPLLPLDDGIRTSSSRVAA